jgi:hypothetical protein
MSRKREQQRESRKELARQMGVHVDEVDDTLRAHARVTEPTLDATLTVHEAKRGWFKKAEPLALHVVLHIVDGSGSRVARAESFRGVAERVPGDVVLTAGEVRGPDKLRYTRPGHFVVTALLTEGALDDAASRHAAALVDPRVQIVAGGETCALTSRVLAGARFEQPQLARFLLDGRVVVDKVLETTVRFVAGSTLTIPAVHRVQETVALTLIDEGFRATLALALRL